MPHYASLFALLLPRVFCQALDAFSSRHAPVRVRDDYHIFTLICQSFGPASYESRVFIHMWRLPRRGGFRLETIARHLQSLDVIVSQEENGCTHVLKAWICLSQGFQLLIMICTTHKQQAVELAELFALAPPWLVSIHRYLSPSINI